MPPSLSDRAREIWPQVIPGLAQFRILTPIDVPALVLLVESMAEYEVVKLQLEQDGRWIVSYDKEGKVTARRRHPAIQELQMLNDRIAAWLTEFGMTPAARAKIALSAPRDREEREDLRQLNDDERSVLRDMAHKRVERLQ